MSKAFDKSKNILIGDYLRFTKAVVVLPTSSSTARYVEYCVIKECMCAKSMPVIVYLIVCNLF